MRGAGRRRGGLAPTLMVQGTASSVGKSLLVTALCRLFADAGLSVAPFKSQNMALNSAVSHDGLEIGRAQAVQAQAARLSPVVEMNPILLKPEGESRCQVVVLGKPTQILSATDYHRCKPELTQVIADSLDTLRRSHDLVLIEGAGSPAEINLKERDIVNMHVARLADAPVLLAGDIDRGGVFAAFVGTLALLEPDERQRVAALVINKFRGDVSLLEPGLPMLTERTGKPVLGVVPFVHDLRIADEDSVALEGRTGRQPPGSGVLDIVVVRLPRISNHDDFDALEHEPGVAVRYATRAAELSGADLVIVPGSKSTIADLEWLHASGVAEVLLARAARDEPIIGVCGGCQMLGGAIDDPQHVESGRETAHGLGLLPLDTRFESSKTTALVKARAASSCILTRDLAPEQELAGYEIHMGTAVARSGAPSPFRIATRSGSPADVPDGAVSPSGSTVGTMIHGLLDNDGVRASLLGALRERRGLERPAAAAEPAWSLDEEYGRLAQVVAGAIDLELLWRLAGV